MSETFNFYGTQIDWKLYLLYVYIIPLLSGMFVAMVLIMIVNTINDIRKLNSGGSMLKLSGLGEEVSSDPKCEEPV